MPKTKDPLEGLSQQTNKRWISQLSKTDLEWFYTVLDSYILRKRQGTEPGAPDCVTIVNKHFADKPYTPITADTFRRETKRHEQRSTIDSRA